jgi:serine/threonine-protein kinase
MAHTSLVPCLLPDNQKRFGRYSLLYRLASGGMANLYVASLAGADGFKKTVAIKIMHRHLTHDPEFVRMFIDEARLASRVVHPNVTQVLDLGRTPHHHYIAMEYVEGESINALMRRTRPSLPCCARIIADAAAGLHAAHELCDTDGSPLGVVHRDVSPDNILVSYSGTVKVTDFGVARTRDCIHTTNAGTVKGKLSYMSPEQICADPVDRRSDIFSLGIVLYEMTTCHRLFKGSSDAETVALVSGCRIPPPSAVVKDYYPRELERVVLTALEPDPSNRFQNAQQLQQELERFLVRSGQLTYSSAVGELMSSVFSERIQRKRELTLQLSEQECDLVPDMQVEVLTNKSAGLPVICVEEYELEIEPEYELEIEPEYELEIEPEPEDDGDPSQIEIAPRSARRSRTLLIGLLMIIVGAALAWVTRPALEARLEPERAQARTTRSTAARTRSRSRLDRRRERERKRVTRVRLAGKQAPVPRVELGEVRIRRRRPPRRPARSRAPPPRVLLALSTQPATEAYLEGKRIGRTPLRAHLPAGQHLLTLKNPRLGLWVTRTIRATGRAKTARFVFGWGRIRFRVKPGRHVSLDGRALGRAPLPPVAVLEGRHAVVVTEPFKYRQQRFSVTVKRGGTTWVSQAL